MNNSFKNLFESDLTNLTEKAKFSKAGGGYVESILNTDGDKVEAFIKAVDYFIEISEDYAKEEGLSTKEQKEQIIDDVTSYVYKKLGGK